MKARALTFVLLLALAFVSAGGANLKPSTACGQDPDRPCDCIANACCTPFCPTCCLDQNGKPTPCNSIAQHLNRNAEFNFKNFKYRK